MEEKKNSTSFAVDYKFAKVRIAEKYNVTPMTLKNWINRNSNLLIALKNAGYNKYQKNFTPKQVEILYEYLGEP